MNSDRDHLSHAIQLADVSLKEGYAPVGVVLVDRDGEVLSAGRSQNIPAGDSGKDLVRLEHAEIQLLLGLQYQPTPKNATLYVSLEPCHMCMGAIIVARISRVVWAMDDYWGGATKLYDMGRDYLQLRMPELVRTPYPELQREAAQQWVDHLNQYNLPNYINRMVRWQARVEAE